MKKTLYFFAAMTLVASSAMASKARLSALGNSQVAVDSDIQGIFQNPSYIHYVGDFATFEMGTKATKASEAVDTNPNPEGGFITTMGDAKFGVYLGKQSTDTNAFRAAVNKALNAEAFLHLKFSTEPKPEILTGPRASHTLTLTLRRLTKSKMLWA
jgi:hypothetical protein